MDYVDQQMSINELHIMQNIYFIMADGSCYLIHYNSLVSVKTNNFIWYSFKSLKSPSLKQPICGRR